MSYVLNASKHGPPTDADWDRAAELAADDGVQDPEVLTHLVWREHYSRR